MNQPIFTDVLKQSRAYKLIRGDFRLGLGHAYMVVSSDEDIIEQFFTLVGATIFCQSKSACFDCPECSKIFHESNPDVYFVNKAGENIKVQNIEELTASTELRSYSGKKIYFVHHADLMNVAAQNKLLKTLEEPPMGVTIFLGVSNEAAMLDTIKSRCRTIYIDIFDRETIFDAMTDLGISESVATIAADCSEGLLGKAYKIAKSPEYTGLYSSALFLLGKLQRSSDIVTLDRIAPLVKQPNEFFNILTVILRDMLAVKENGDMLSKHVSNEITSLASGFSAKAISEIILLINEARKKLYYNVNQQATIDSLLFSILEVKYKWQ